MKEVVDEESNVNQKEEIHECRACLKKMENNASICNIFQSWVPPWAGMEATIAEDLVKLAKVEVRVVLDSSDLSFLCIYLQWFSKIEITIYVELGSCG